MSYTSPEFWIALLQIIGVNIVLSGDNAVVIALAARGLPPEHQKKAVAWGSGAAVLMRIVLTIVAVELLRLPYLKIVGAGLLMWIAIQLLVPEEGEDGAEGGVTSMAAAIKTILLADLVMSLDNVIAVAAAAKGNTLLLVIGLAISIPLVVFASQVLLRLMDRFPVIITLGAALLGWVAGDMAVTDPIDKPWVDLHAAFLHWGAPLGCAITVIVVGKWLAARKRARAREGAATAVAPAATAVPAAAAGAAALRRILLAVDGSEGSTGAVRHALKLRAQLVEPASVELHLLNVQRPVSGDVAQFIAKDSVQDYLQERSEQALVAARGLLAAAGLKFKEHMRVGAPDEVIAATALSEHCDLIVMGSRGLGSSAAAMLGSIAQGVLEKATVPVLLSK